MHLPEQSSPDLTSVEHRFRNCHPLKKPMPQTVAGKHCPSSTGNAVLSSGIFLGKRKKKKLCKQSHATNPLVARLMWLRIKRLLSSDIKHVLQIASIKAFPDFRSLRFYNWKQSKHSALSSASQPLKDAALHCTHCLH